MPCPARFPESIRTLRASISGKASTRGLSRIFAMPSMMSYPKHFLLGGRRLSMGEPLPGGDYYALVSRAERRPDCEVYAWTVRDRLPTIPIPLSAPDEDVKVDLGAVFTTAYTRGRYARLVDYSAPPSALRKSQERAWAEKIARRGRR